MAKKQALVLRATTFAAGLTLGPGAVVEGEAKDLKPYADDGSIDTAAAAVQNALAKGAKPVALPAWADAKD